jgi:hypothetical protein
MPKPDFSGTWRFNPAKSVLQIPAPDSTEIEITHREPALRISRTHTIKGRRDTFFINLTTDGREVHVDRADIQLQCRAYWDGETLVFDSRFARDGEDATNVVRYTLVNGCDEFRAKERFRSASLSYDNLWVLERIPA